MRWNTAMILAVTIAASATGQPRQSFNGTYKLWVEAPQNVTRNAVEETMWTYVVLDQAGNVTTEVRRAVPFDVAAPEPLVFENGRILLLHSFDAFAELYDRTGDLLRRIPLLADPTPDYERVIRSAVHISTVLVGVTLGGDGVRIVSVDGDGNLSERRRLEGMNVTGMAVSFDPDLYTVGTMTWRQGVPVYETTVVRGTEAWKVPVGFTEGMFVGEELFVGIRDRGVYGLSLRSRRIEWSEESPEGRMLIDAKMLSGKISILSARKPHWFEGGWIYASPRLRTLTVEGTTISDRTLDRGSFSTGTLETAQGKIVARLDGKIVE